MLIEAYFQEIENTVAEAYTVVNAQLVTEKRSLYIGFVEGRLTFVDDSILNFMEFVNVESGVHRYNYSFHYKDSMKDLTFRYDMVPHCTEVTTYPYHKHTGEEEVSDAGAPSLAEVLDEIEQIVQ